MTKRLLTVLLLALVGLIGVGNRVVNQVATAGGTGSPGTADLAHYWSFENNLTDSHGSADGVHSGSSGASYSASGIQGYARANDRANNHKVTITEADVNMGGWSAFSISAWVQSDLASSSTEDIIAWWNYTASERSWVLTDHNDSYQYFFEMMRSSGSTVVTYGTGDAGTGWHHVVVTFDGSNIRMYRDGVLVTGPSAHTGGIQDQPGVDITIGAQEDNSTAANVFSGLIDEVAIFDDVLTADEIEWLYNTGSGRAYGDL